MAGLLDWITGAVQQQYAKGAPYREAIGGLLQGDPTKFGLLAQEFNRKAQTPEGALDVALNVNPMLTFVGKSSKLWNSDLAKKAVELEKKGISPEEIWRQTGTVRGPDKLWRQEISDRTAKPIPVENKDITYSLPKVLSHEKLYQSYPDLETTMMGFKKTTGQSSAYYPEMDMIKLGEMKSAYKNEAQYNKELNKIYKIADDLDKKGLLTPEKNDELTKMADDLANKWFDNAPIVFTASKSPLLHEIQHAVQQKEGFGKGGNVSEFLDYGFSGNLKPSSTAQLDAYNQYKKLLGEAEARMTERRINLTPEQRLQYFPYSEGKYGLDVPYNELIIRGLLD